ncbi:Gfo/Idh/MocA family protein [Deinococcus yavapaiensis]|uniref:Putative dehydrogenase n=1 Tax=Deinococcus yavapaiensis KR-236 TaxID=694435 RepID=A0A318S494_9DEIO|nr:Gfo/Idh/MocA family oxidoreductase [Deinococcus yavapaiensis]PYE51878.1 putative dehydrogenase [Deinococcus yavapaiensis KR-236]
MTSLRWGFLGAARIGHALAPAVKNAGHVLQAVAARDVNRAREFAGRYDVARAYGSYDELLADPEVDAIYNPLPNDAHLPMTVAALEAGKHVLCEKPLVMNAEEARALREASERTGKLVLEAFAYRFHPGFERAREVVASGALGDLRLGHALFCFTLDRPDDFRWSAEKGGGGLYDVGCYCVNGLRMLLGREPTRASAFQRLERGVDGTLSGLLDFGEASATVNCGQAASYQQRLTLVGTNGSMVFDHAFTSKGGGHTLRVNGESETIEHADAYQRMVEHFGRAAHGVEPLRFTMDDSVAQARVLDALFASARQGHTVDV